MRGDFAFQTKALLFLERIKFDSLSDLIQKYQKDYLPNKSTTLTKPYSEVAKSIDYEWLDFFYQKHTYVILSARYWLQHDIYGPNCATYFRCYTLDLSVVLHSLNQVNYSRPCRREQSHSRCMSRRSHAIPRCVYTKHCVPRVCVFCFVFLCFVLFCFLIIAWRASIVVCYQGNSCGYRPIGVQNAWVCRRPKCVVRSRFLCTNTR